MLKRVLTFICLVFIFDEGVTADSPLSKEVIETWWKADSTEEIKIEGDLVAIRLRNKEDAYLVKVGFYDRGRNDIWHLVLVRPYLKQVREAPEPLGSTFEVYDLDRDGVSEIVSVSSGSGQGTTWGTKAIVQIDGWKPIVLRIAEFSEGCGFVGKTMRCSGKSVSWRFADLDGDQKTDLIEEIDILPSSPANKPAAISKVVNKFLFKDGAFLPYGEKKHGAKRKIDD